MVENSNIGACKACSGTVSRKAKTCPHCGQRKPFKRGPTQVPRSFAWGMILATLIIGLNVVMPDPPPSSGTAENSHLSDPIKQQSWISVSEHGIRNRLKDPQSAKFKDSYFVSWNSTPVVCGWVNSKNSMGGYSGFQRFVAAGEKLAYLEEEVADFGNVWDKMCLKQ